MALEKVRFIEIGEKRVLWKHRTFLFKIFPGGYFRKNKGDIMFNLLPRRIQLFIAAILVWILHGVPLKGSLNSVERILKEEEKK